MPQKAIDVLPLVLLVVALAVSVFFSLYKLTEAPAIWYDEGIYTQVAMNFAEQGTEGIQIAPGEFISAKDATVGYPLLAPVALSYTLFGVGVLQGRAVMVLFIIGFILAGYVLVRLLYGPWFAGWTALILAVVPQLYGNGKSVLGEVPGLSYLVLCFIALYYLEHSAYRNLWAYVGVGVAAGLAVATKPIFILLPLALGITYFLSLRRMRLRLGGVCLGILAFVLPVAVWVELQFGHANSLSAILAYYINPYEVTSFANLVMQNLMRFWSEGVPAITLALMVLWAVALVLRSRRHTPASVTELAAFVFCLAVLAAFLRLPGWYRYFFPALMIALIFAPYIIAGIFTNIAKKITSLDRVAWLPYAGFVLVAVGGVYALSAHSYVAQYYAGHRTEALSAYFAALPPHTSYFMYNVPEVVILLPNRNYYQFFSPHPTQLIGEKELPVLASGMTDFVVLTTEAYDRQKDLFDAYSERGSVAKYTFLQKI